MLDFVKLMYAAGCPIDGYLFTGAITQAEYDEIMEDRKSGEPS